MSDDANWWVDGPIFSAQDRGGKITIIAPGERVRLFSAPLLLLMLFSAVAWTAVFALWLPRMLQYGRPAAMVETAHTWWWVSLLIAAVLLVLVLTGAVYSMGRRAFRRVDIAVAAAAIPATTGIIAGCWIDGIRVGATPADGIGADASIQLIFMGAALAALIVLLAWSPFAIARSRRRAALIAHLRAHGVRYEGELRALGTANGTVLGKVQFSDAEVAYANGTRKIAVAMSTQPSRVPLPPFPVVVFVGADGEVHVDPDSGHPWPFDPDVDKYSDSVDGGGG